jgi:hypothetical protein
MSSIVISGDTSGAITLSAPAVAGTNTATLPAATGTVMVSGNMPAFSAYRGSSVQSFTASTWTKIAFNTEEFDTASAFDSTTNYRFTPQVAGYYQVSGCAQFQFTGSSTITGLDVYKNGTSFKGNQLWLSATTGCCVTTSNLIYLNGSTDYIELYAYCNGISPSINTTADLSFFQATLIRAA